MLHWFGWAIHDTATLQHDRVLEGSFQVRGIKILSSTLKDPEQDTLHQSMQFLLTTQVLNISAVQNLQTSASLADNTQSIFLDISPSSTVHLLEVETRTLHSAFSPSMLFSVWAASTQPTRHDDVVNMVTEDVNHIGEHVENHTIDFVNSTVLKVQKIEVSDYTTAEIFGIACGVAILIFAVGKYIKYILYNFFVTAKLSIFVKN